MKFLSFFAVAGVALSSLTAQATPLPGPDAFGYTATNIGYSLRSVSGGNSVVGGDDQFSTVTLPFSFNFYGNAYSSAWVSTNGLIGFGANADSYCCTGSAPGVSNSISLSWMDWVTTVTSKTIGSIGSREYVLNWSGTEFGSGSILAQMILHESTNAIEFQYNSLINDGHSQFIGITNTGATTFLGTAYGTGGGDQRQTALLFSTVPEPGSLALLGLGLAGLAYSRKRKTETIEA